MYSQTIIMRFFRFIDKEVREKTSQKSYHTSVFSFLF